MNETRRTIKNGAIRFEGWTYTQSTPELQLKDGEIVNVSPWAFPGTPRLRVDTLDGKFMGYWDVDSHAYHLWVCGKGLPK